VNSSDTDVEFHKALKSFNELSISADKQQPQCSKEIEDDKLSRRASFPSRAIIKTFNFAKLPDNLDENGRCASAASLKPRFRPYRARNSSRQTVCSNKADEDEDCNDKQLDEVPESVGSRNGQLFAARGQQSCSRDVSSTQLEAAGNSRNSTSADNVRIQFDGEVDELSE